MERRFNNNRGFNQNNNRQSPVNVGEEIVVRIEAVGEKGDGIAKRNGFVLFVPNAKEGQNVKIKITKVLSKVGFAEVIGEADASEVAASQPRYEKTNLPPPSPVEEKRYEDSDNFGDEEEEE